MDTFVSWDLGKREGSEILAYHTFGVSGSDSFVRERHKEHISGSLYPVQKGLNVFYPYYTYDLAMTLVLCTCINFRYRITASGLLVVFDPALEMSVLSNCANRGYLSVALLLERR